MPSLHCCDINKCCNTVAPENLSGDQANKLDGQHAEQNVKKPEATVRNKNYELENTITNHSHCGTVYQTIK